MSDINKAVARLGAVAKDPVAGPGGFTAIVGVYDLRALLADHARLQAVAEKLERFRSLARWVSNCAGHGINSNQRRLGEELLALIDAARAVQP